MIAGQRIAVVIPCHNVRRHILAVLSGLGEEVDDIYVVDDACPEHSGDVVEESCQDHRVRVLRHKSNQGVGGAMVTGYRQACADGADIVVKMDGDDQMDPRVLPRLVAPIVDGRADYCKGNRFFEFDVARKMPLIRLVGNVFLSLMTKASTGYWNVVDPTNGYTAISSICLKGLDLERVHRRYFFETDLLALLGLHRAVVVDVDIPARYGNERSGLRVLRIIPEFTARHALNTTRRLLSNYFITNVSIASFYLCLGSMLLSGGALFGALRWYQGAREGVLTPAGTVMLATLPVLAGLHFLSLFLEHDLRSVPQPRQASGTHTCPNCGSAQPTR